MGYLGQALLSLLNGQIPVDLNLLSIESLMERFLSAMSVYGT